MPPVSHPPAISDPSSTRPRRLAGRSRVPRSAPWPAERPESHGPRLDAQPAPSPSWPPLPSSSPPSRTWTSPPAVHAALCAGAHPLDVVFALIWTSLLYCLLKQLTL